MRKFKVWFYSLGTIGTIIALISVQALLRYKAQKGSSHRIILWHSYIDKEAEVLKKLINKYNENPELNKGYKVEILSVSFSNFSDKLTNSLPRGQGPDLFIYGHDRIEDWLAKDLLAPVDYFVTPMELENFTPKSSVNAFIRGKRLYGLPLSVKNLAVYYRKLPNGTDVGAKINELQMKSAWNMENFIKLAKSLTHSCPWQTGNSCYGLGYQADDAYHHAPWLHAFSGTILDKNGRPALVTKANIEAAGLAYKLAGFHSDAVVPRELSYPLMADMFKKGEIAMVISGPWFMGQLKQAKVPFGVTVFPTVKGKKARPFLTIEGVYMSKKAKNREASFRVMKYLTGQRSSLIRAERAGQLPVLRTVKTKMQNRCKQNSNCVYNQNYYAVFSKVASDAVLMPATRAARIIWPPYTKALAAIIKRGVSAKKALSEAQWESEKYLGACIGGKK